MAADQFGLGTGEPTFCPDCLRSLWMGGRCKRRDCPGYAPIYLRDQGRRLRENLAVWGGKTCLVTLTAPGADVLPWDKARCRPGAHACSGKRGCQVELLAAATWNSTATGRLGDLLKVAREQVRRAHGGAARVRVLAIVFEAQQRGVFHPHVVLGYGTSVERAALDTFRDALRRKRGGYGFGTGRRGSFDAGLPDQFTGSDAGRYIAKYLRPDGAKRTFVPLLAAIAMVTPRDPETGRAKRLVRPVFVSPVLTRETGVTMGFLRFCRWAYMVWRVKSTREELRFAHELRRKLGAVPVGPGTRLTLPVRSRPPTPRSAWVPIVQPVSHPRYVQLSLTP